MDGIIIKAKELAKEIGDISDIQTKIEYLNTVRKELHLVSPLKHHPVDYVIWEVSKRVEANEYNPNHVAKQEMKLLVTSIVEDGYTMPIVTNEEKSGNGWMRRIIDGFHRRKAEQTTNKITKSTYGRIPVTQIRSEKSDLKNRMAATVRHNRARGVHGIEPMSIMVADLIKEGCSNSEIATQLGMDADEVLRLKQITGIAEIFKNHEYSNSWE